MLQLMVRGRLERLRNQVLLGLVLTAGMLTKLSFALYAAGPVLLLLARGVRSRQAAKGENGREKNQAGAG